MRACVHASMAADLAKVHCLALGELGCAIGNAGSSSIAEALARNTTLTSVELGREWGRCVDTRASGPPAAAAVPLTRRWTFLPAENAIDPAGATAIAEALRLNVTITGLEMSGEGDDGRDVVVSVSVCPRTRPASRQLRQRDWNCSDCSTSEVEHLYYGD